MDVVWTEERIREEFRRLDDRTGLSGAGLPIKFGRSKSRMAAFIRPGKSGWMYFYFSVHWFHDPDFLPAAALQTIRHEYAHYMDWIYSYDYNLTHGQGWIDCCISIGTEPDRLFCGPCPDDIRRLRQDIAELEEKRRAIIADIRKLRQKIAELEEKHRAIKQKYKAGTKVIHPKFGSGIVISTSDHGQKWFVEIDFGENGVKLIDLKWMCDNIKKIT